MKAIMVCVDYSDYLAITLPRNRHHFDEVMVVTSLADTKTRRICRDNNATTFCTESFWEDGADFNKWKALELGLDALGRDGWICLMDADVIWPKTIPPVDYQAGHLYTPRRRMMYEVVDPLPLETEWDQFPVHKNDAEFAGYSQIFHGSDAALGEAPWHDINWKHAGGADSFFQLKWARSRKIRPPWEVLHLGPAGCNWCGRATDYLDGTKIEGGEEKMNRLRAYVHGRRAFRRGGDPFRGEKT
jgi:hypothetical protein